MRLLFLIAGIALPLAATPAQSPTARAPAAEDARAEPIGAAAGKCRNPYVQFIDSAGKPRARRLDELPPASLTLAVVREVDGCNEPVIVRYGIGVDPETVHRAPYPPLRARRW